MFKREFKINLKSLIIWTSIIIIFFLIVFLMYPSITSSDNVKQIDEMMKIFPEEVLQMFNFDIASIDSVFGWIKTEGYTFLLLIGGMYAAILGATILTKEENDKTIEFLASKPVSRKKIVTSKIACGIINICIFVFAIMLFNFIGLIISNDLDLKPFLLLSFAPLLLYLILFSICLFVSTFLRKTRTTMGLAIGITFISFLMQILGGISDKFEFIKNISLFQFVSGRYIILNNTYDIKYIIIGVIIIIACLGLTYRNFNKKELI